MGRASGIFEWPNWRLGRRGARSRGVGAPSRRLRRAVGGIQLRGDRAHPNCCNNNYNLWWMRDDNEEGQQQEQRIQNVKQRKVARARRGAENNKHTPASRRSRAFAESPLEARVYRTHSPASTASRIDREQDGWAASKKSPNRRSIIKAQRRQQQLAPTTAAQVFCRVGAHIQLSSSPHNFLATCNSQLYSPAKWWSERQATRTANIFIIISPPPPRS